MSDTVGRASQAAKVPQVELRGIRKAFGDVQVLWGVDLSIRAGEFVSLLGPSGCGKTTTLNILAGFLSPDQGAVELGGSSVTHLPPYRRNLGMVFQRYTLFPHMSIFENVAFGLRLRKVSERDTARRVREMLELVRLPGVGDRFPSQLSGGQQQRIALARALVVEPKVLLLDEPLSNLDAKLRREMQIEIRRLHENLGVTTVYVTHDQEESLVLSDRIAVMHEGRIAQLDAPRAIYERPRTRFVAQFIGETNFISGSVVERNGQQLLVDTAVGGRLVVDGDAIPAGVAPGARIDLIVREEHVGLSATPSGVNSVSVKINRVVFQGATQRYFVQAEGVELRASVPIRADEALEAGRSAFAVIAPEALVILEPGQSLAAQDTPQA